MIVKEIDEVFAEAEKTFLKLELLEEEPKIGEYFGIITNVECLTPYYSDKSSYISEVFTIFVSFNTARFIALLTSSSIS